MNSSATAEPRIARSRRTTWSGEARLPRVSPEPSMACTPEPLAAGEALDDARRRRAVVPALPKSAPSSLSSISA